MDVTAKADTPWYKLLYMQVLVAIVLGALLGWLAPGIAANPWIDLLGKAFIKLISMAIAPIIFCTIVSGIAHIQQASTVGRIFVKTIVYFEVVSTLALAIGLAVGSIVRPGANFGGASDAIAANASKVETFAKAAEVHANWPDFFLALIPKSMFGPIAEGNVLQVIVISVLFGFALMGLGKRGEGVRHLIDEATQAMFGVIRIVMYAAPLGAFGAMAVTVAKFGIASLLNLLGLVATFYLTSILFVVIVLGIIARFAGVNIFKLLNYIKDELLLVLGTSSSESALPGIMRKLENMGCSKSVVGLVIPTGYSFNLDGTNIYMTLAVLFIAQALGVELGWGEQAVVLATAMATSKGATGVTGAGFITLGATLAAVDPKLVPGLAIVFGIDKFMSECRAIVNLIGNTVATVVIAASEGELQRDALDRALAMGQAAEEVVPAE